MIVPAWYLPPHKKEIDYNAEAAAFLSGKFYLSDGYALPSPPAAWYSMLELITSRFYLDPLGCSADDLFYALALLDAGRKGVRAADQYRKGDKVALQALADVFRDAHGEAAVNGVAEIFEQTLLIPFQGLEMLPKTGPHEEKEYIFDADFLASVCGAVAMGIGDDFDRILWDVPLLRLGYLRVFRSRYEGEKGIQRPDNETIIRAELKAAEERESRGELHPWQKAEPFRFEPSEVQIAARPEIIDEHLRLKMAFREKLKGKK